MASKFEHMGYVGIAVVNDSERSGRTLTRVFTSPNPPKDYLKQRRHSGSEEWTLIFDELVPNVDGKFGVLEFINTNSLLQNYAFKQGNKLSTDAYFKGSPNDIVSIVKTCIQSSSDALLRNEIVLATTEQLNNDTDFQQFTKERLSKSESNSELLLAGGSIRETKVIDAMRILKESRYPLTLAAITKAIYGKGKNDYISQEEKEKTKDVLSILANSSFLNIVKDPQNDNSRFSAYPAFKIAQLTIMSQLLPSLNIMGQLGYLFDKSSEKPTENTPYLTDPELEKKAKIARLEDHVKGQVKIYLDSDSFAKEKNDEFIKGVKYLTTNIDDRLDITTLDEANRYYHNKFSPEQKLQHQKMFSENIREVVQFKAQKIRKSLTGEMLIKTFDSKDIEKAKQEGEFNLLEADKAGFVYILYNSENHIFKIGETSRNPQGRANELSAAQDMPTGWVLARGKNGSFDYQGFVFTEDRQLLEALMHTRFSNERFNKQREFFRSENKNDAQFFETLAAESKNARMAIREFHHTGKTVYPFMELAQKELEIQSKRDLFKAHKAQQEEKEEKEFLKVVEQTIDNRKIEPIKSGLASPDYDNPLFVPIVQTMHYNFFRKDIKNNLRANPRTRGEIREQLTMFYPELSGKINNEDIENVLDLLRTIDPPIIKETVRPNSNETHIRISNIDKNLIDELNNQLPKLNIQKNLGYLKLKNIPDDVDKRFTITSKTVALMSALKADKRNKTLNELTNELGLSEESVKDLMEGFNKEIQTNNLIGHKKAIFSLKADKNNPEKMEMYGGNLKFTKSHIQELTTRYPDVGFETIEVLFDEDNPKDPFKANEINHAEIEIPLMVQEPDSYPNLDPNMEEIPLHEYSENIVFEDDGQAWLENIPVYPNPVEDEIKEKNTIENELPAKAIENASSTIQNDEVEIEIIKLLKIKGSPGSFRNNGKVTAKKTLSPEEISAETKIDINLINDALARFENQQVNPLYVRDFEDRKVYGMNYKIQQEDLINLGIFNTANIEHRKVLSLFNKENPSNVFTMREDSQLSKSTEIAKTSAERVNVAESLCPKALREIENLMPEDVFNELKKLAISNPEELITWLKEGKKNTLKM